MEKLLTKDFVLSWMFYFLTNRQDFVRANLGIFSLKILRKEVNLIGHLIFTDYEKVFLTDSFSRTLYVRGVILNTL